jgi:uncharacterized alkaline shock family protein YloU
MAVEEIASGTSPEEGDIHENDGGRIFENEEVDEYIATIEMVKLEVVITLSVRSSYSDYDGAKCKDVEKGVSVKITENRCSVAVEINIKYGANVYDTARKLQRAIKNAIESYTGLVVERVDVTIRGMINEGPLPPAKNKAA